MIDISPDAFKNNFIKNHELEQLALWAYLGYLANFTFATLYFQAVMDFVLFVLRIEIVSLGHLTNKYQTPVKKLPSIIDINNYY